MIRLLVRAALLAAVVALLAERWLAGRTGGQPRPIETLVVVDAPIERVWARVADVENQPRWMHDLKAVRIVTPGPVGLGTSAMGRVRILGLGVTDPVTVTGWEPPHRFAVRHEGRFKGHGEITLQEGADGTTTIVRWHETLVPPGLPHVGAALGGPILRAIFQADLHRLRALVEIGEPRA